MEAGEQQEPVSAARERRRVVVGGRVQGVGFRWFVRDTAEALGLRGWVRNLPDGHSVEAVAEGDRDQLDSFVARMREGPGGSYVAELQASSEPPGAPLEGFEIRP